MNIYYLFSLRDGKPPAGEVPNTAPARCLRCELSPQLPNQPCTCCTSACEPGVLMLSSAVVISPFQLSGKLKLKAN